MKKHQTHLYIIKERKENKTMKKKITDKKPRWSDT